MKHLARVPVLSIDDAAALAGISTSAVVDLICTGRVKAAALAELFLNGESLGKDGYWGIGKTEIIAILKGEKPVFISDSRKEIHYVGGMSEVRVETQSLQEWLNQTPAPGTLNNAPPPDRSHVSDELALLNQASQKWWANADKLDPATHPSNPEVTVWLVERGMTKTLASKAASIIRPEWAHTGRKPDV